MRGFNVTYPPSQFDPEGIQNQIEKPGVAQLIADTIDSALLTQALRSAAILGTIAGSILNGDRTIRYQDRDVVRALRITFDDDLAHFVHPVEYARDHEEDLKKSHRHLHVKDLAISFDPDGDPFAYELTFEKLKSVQMVYAAYGSGSIGGPTPSPRGYVTLMPLSDYLYEVVTTARDRGLIDLPGPLSRLRIRLVPDSHLRCSRRRTMPRTDQREHSSSGPY